MKKSTVIFLVASFVQFITVSAFATNSHSLDKDSSMVEEFSLKTDYTSRINMKEALFSVNKPEAGAMILIQENAEAMSLEEEIKSLKKKRTGYLVGAVGLLGLAGFSIYQFTQVEPTKGAHAGAGEAEGETSSTTGMGKMVWVTLGAISGAIGAVLISSYSKTNKEIKAKEKELENLSQAQERLARALSK